MRTARSAALLFSAAALSAAIAAHAQPPLQRQNDLLVDHAGMTVYTYDKDMRNSGKSVCNDACADNWPPVKATANAKAEGDYGIVERDDGTRQWAYKGQPLYTFVKDGRPGDRAGDNVRNVWHVVKP